MKDKSDLSERIKAARKDVDDTKEKYQGKISEETIDEKRSKRAASEFLGLVIAGVIVGILCDKFLNTAPLGLFFFIIMGFIGGVFRANKLTQKND